MIEDDEAEVARYTKYVETTDDITLIAITDSASRGFELTEELKPDVVLLDLELHEGSGIQYLYDLYKSDIYPRPFILVITWNQSRSVLRNVREHGAGLIQQKANKDYIEAGPEIVINLLRHLEPYFYLENGDREPPMTAVQATSEENDEQKRKNISDTLDRIGIESGSTAHILLAESILVGSKIKSGLIDMENVIYPILMKKFKCTKTAAERAMRSKIETAWLSTDPAVLEREYTQYINPDKGKPELKKFISYYARKFR